MSKHTPGPWHREQTINTWSIAADGTTVFLIGDNRRLIPRDPDANLIAAAPELFDCCRDMLNELWEMRDDWSVADDVQGLVDRAAEVIAKAKGE
jgi:hypothetical protein